MSTIAFISTSDDESTLRVNLKEITNSMVQYPILFLNTEVEHIVCDKSDSIFYLGKHPDSTQDIDDSDSRRNPPLRSSPNSSLCVGFSTQSNFSAEFQGIDIDPFACSVVSATVQKQDCAQRAHIHAILLSLVISLSIGLLLVLLLPYIGVGIHSFRSFMAQHQEKKEN